MNSQEAMAFQLIFRGDDALSIAMRSRIADSIVVERVNTVVGFYSTIKLIPPLDAAHDFHEIWARDFNFNYPSPPHGGSLNCSFESADSVEIEGVTLGGGIEWPSHLDANLIVEMS